MKVIFSHCIFNQIYTADYLESLDGYFFFQLDLSDCLLTSDSLNTLIQVVSFPTKCKLCCNHQLRCHLSGLYVHEVKTKNLIQGLMSNTSVKTVFMKGNNISGNTVRYSLELHTISYKPFPPNLRTL